MAFTGRDAGADEALRMGFYKILLVFIFLLKVLYLVHLIQKRIVMKLQ